MRTVVLRRDNAPDLEAAQPSAKTDHVRHFLVAQFDHGFFHVGLCFDQFEFESGPVAAHAELEEAVRAGGEALSHGEAFGLAEEGASDVLDDAFLFRDHGEETIADERAEIERGLEAVVVGAVKIGCGQQINRHRFENLEFGEEALDGRRGQLVHPQLLAGKFVLQDFGRRLRSKRDGREDHQGTVKGNPHKMSHPATNRLRCPWEADPISRWPAGGGRRMMSP